LISSIVNYASVNEREKIVEWEEKLEPCEHTLILNQTGTNKVAPKYLMHCGECNLSSNLWLCLTCGHLGCSRNQMGGVEGNSHGVEHYEKNKDHPLVVKTGTITPEGEGCTIKFNV
jgi:ubiquitin carboxyl-terminal hydrolase 5/13